MTLLREASSGKEEGVKVSSHPTGGENTSAEIIFGPVMCANPVREDGGYHMMAKVLHFFFFCTCLVITDTSEHLTSLRSARQSHTVSKDRALPTH